MYISLIKNHIKLLELACRLDTIDKDIFILIFMSTPNILNKE